MCLLFHQTHYFSFLIIRTSSLAFVDPMLIMDFIVGGSMHAGFVTSKVACCGQGRYNGVATCNALSNLCPNRDIYAFWDAFHPTQRALGFIVDGIFSGTSDLMTPMNLSTIMAMDSNV